MAWKVFVRQCCSSPKSFSDFSLDAHNTDTNCGQLMDQLLILHNRYDIPLIFLLLLTRHPPANLNPNIATSNEQVRPSTVNHHMATTKRLTPDGGNLALHKFQ